MKKSKSLSIETRCVHAGQDGKIEGAVVMPIFQSAPYLYGGEERYEDIRYVRLNNSPNHQLLHRKLAALEEGEAGLVASSGMAAISAALLASLKSGDHLLAQSGLYGGTHQALVHDFKDVGIEVSFVEGPDPDDWEKGLRPQTRAVYLESITNPLLRVDDLPGIVDFARKHGLVTIIDNTFATPVNFRPLKLGFDIVVHSATKYLNGHSDLAAGVVVSSRERISAINGKLLHLGGCLDPHACFLLERGLKTLALRVRYQNQSALALARALQQHPLVKTVNYPGLSTHPDHERASKLMTGFAGMLSFEVEGGGEAAVEVVEHLQIATHAPSLGGPETLVTRPATTSHLNIPAAERERIGISDALVRVSVGLEGTADLIADFNTALSAAEKVAGVKR